MKEKAEKQSLSCIWLGAVAVPSVCSASSDRLKVQISMPPEISSRFDFYVEMRLASYEGHVDSRNQEAFKAGTSLKLSEISLPTGKKRSVSHVTFWKVMDKNRDGKLVFEEAK